MTQTVDESRRFDVPPGLPEDLPIMGCNRCYAVMVRRALKSAAEQYGLHIFSGRVRERPYCTHCLDDGEHRLRVCDRGDDRRYGRVARMGNGDNPGFSNAVRALEGENT